MTALSSRILIVDDEAPIRALLGEHLQQVGYDVTLAPNGCIAMELLNKGEFDLVLTDLKMPGMTGLELLARVREVDAEVPVMLLTAYGTVQTAVDAMKLGAFDYVLKPFDLEVVELTVRKALEMRQYRTENRYLREQVQPAPSFESMVGDSAAMESVYDLIRRVGPTRSAVLLTGETGTGKELVARAIHGLSPRRDRLFVPLNCAAIPPDLLESELFGHTRGAFTGAQADRTGKFELADGGTLFLDEIGDMAYPLQAKLLRVLQEGVIERIGSNKQITLDVRVLSSTHRDLTAGIRAGTFREDLYYRLNVFHLHLPPLRERQADVGHLAGFFLTRFCQELGKPAPALGPAACQLLEQHAWPGNVRELQNLMERAAVLATGPEIEPSFFRLLLPQPSNGNGDSAGDTLALEPAVEQVERKLILRALSAANDNKAQAARLLGVSERTLWYKLKRYGL